MLRQKTRFKDKNGNTIYVGDIVHVEEYPKKYVGGSLDYDGVVEEINDDIVVTYYDIGEVESSPLSSFPVCGRRIFSEKERYNYWKTAFLGGEPPRYLWEVPEKKRNGEPKFEP